MASFVSENELSKSRKHKRKMRNDILESAKSDFMRKQEILQQRKDSGQDKWMVSSVEKRLEKESSKHKSQHKHKKHKKHKKKSKKEYSSSDESEENEDQWVERQQQVFQEKEEWMKQDFLSGIRTISSKEVKEKHTKHTENVQNKSLSCLDQPGIHEKELNPFWKSGNQGLPTENDKSTSDEHIPDYAWLQRSLKRMQEQSEESERTIESIAADRYGSWQKFQDLLDKARKKAGVRHDDNYIASHKKSTTSYSKRKFLKPSDNSSSVYSNQSRSSQNSSARWKKSKQKDTLPEQPANKPEQKPPLSIPDNSKTQDDGINKSQNIRKNNAGDSVSSSVVLKKILTEEEKNVIGAKIIKAELMGNDALVQKLKQKLADSKEAEAVKSSTSITDKPESTPEPNNSGSSSEDSSSDEETVVLTRMTKTGQSWPVTASESSQISHGGKRKKKKKLQTHDNDGNRERYFADDDKYSLKDLIEQERSGAADTDTHVMSRLNAKLFTRTDGDNFTLDDMFESESGNISRTQHRQKAIASHNKLKRRLEKCKYCFGNAENPKHLTIAIGRVAYLRLPGHCALEPGHCIIAPMHHCATGTSLDEDIWEEIRKFMQSLRNMFLKQDKDCIFLQTCLRLHSSPHFHIECIPLPMELGEEAPIYFKKAIQECEGEWAQNKKLIDTRGKSIKDKVPAGLPYFAVEFGLSGGFAHVVEDDTKFPVYFGREILGGMLDADPLLWRRPKEERFNEQIQRAVQFEKWFKNFDWTQTEIS